MVVGLERDLGVQREAIERGAQLARQGERPRLAPTAERLEAYSLAALRQHAAALERGRVELGEERLVGFRLDFLRFTAQPTAAREMAQDAPVEERRDLCDVAIGDWLGQTEDRPREGPGARVDAAREGARPCSVRCAQKRHCGAASAPGGRRRAAPRGACRDPDAERERSAWRGRARKIRA